VVMFDASWCAKKFWAARKYTYSCMDKTNTWLYVSAISKMSQSAPPRAGTCQHETTQWWVLSSCKHWKLFAWWQHQSFMSMAQM
jgi:hypothetical protein